MKKSSELPQAWPTGIRHPSGAWGDNRSIPRLGVNRDDVRHHDKSRDFVGLFTMSQRESVRIQSGDKTPRTSCGAASHVESTGSEK
jgi:hypothetical protein